MHVHNIHWRVKYIDLTTGRKCQEVITRLPVGVQDSRWSTNAAHCKCECRLVLAETKDCMLQGPGFHPFISAAIPLANRFGKNNLERDKYCVSNR